MSPRQQTAPRRAEAQKNFLSFFGAGGEVTRAWVGEIHGREVDAVRFRARKFVGHLSGYLLEEGKKKREDSW